MYEARAVTYRQRVLIEDIAKYLGIRPSSYPRNCREASGYLTRILTPKNKKKLERKRLDLELDYMDYQRNKLYHYWEENA